MPATIAKHGSMWRVVEASTGMLVKGNSGMPVDGGGFRIKENAEAQARAINARQQTRPRRRRRRFRRS